MFYLALGYFISYLPYALLAKALSSASVPDGPIAPGGLVLLPPAAALGQVLAMPSFLGGTAVRALTPDVADRTHCLADSDGSQPAAALSDDHRYIAALIQQAAQKRLAERFL